MENLDYNKLYDLGCTKHANLNFAYMQENSKVYPIMSAASKGSIELMELLL